MAEFLGKISTFIWGSGLVFLLLLTGIIYTLKLGFIQFKLIPRLIHCTHKNFPPKDMMTIPLYPWEVLLVLLCFMCGENAW